MEGGSELDRQKQTLLKGALALGPDVMKAKKERQIKKCSKEGMETTRMDQTNSNTLKEKNGSSVPEKKGGELSATFSEKKVEGETVRGKKRAHVRPGKRGRGAKVSSATGHAST